MLLFAKQILFAPLCEYVQSLNIKTHWVPTYSVFHCHVYAPETVQHVVFLQRGPEWALLEFLTHKKIKVSILNTEQMTRYIAPRQEGDEVPFPFDNFLMSYIRSGKLESIIDYTVENIKIWKMLFYNLNVHLRCFLSRPTLITMQKTKDVVFVGDASSDHRQDILRVVEPTILVGSYGPKRDSVLYAHKILLNIHFGPTYNVFEELRCLPCVLAGMVVVSETSKFDANHPLHKFIIFANYDELAFKIEDVQANYDSIQHKLYCNNTAFDNLLTDIKVYENQVNSKIE